MGMVDLPVSALRPNFPKIVASKSFTFSALHISPLSLGAKAMFSKPTVFHCGK
jgi:hypothetical protein